MSAYSDAVLADGPAAYWRFSETSGAAFADASGNGRGGTFRNGYTRNAASLLATDPDPAVALDGSTGIGEVPTGTWMWATAFTAEAWVNLEATNPEHSVVFAHDNNGTNIRWRLFIQQSRQVSCYFNRASGGLILVTAPTPLNLNQTYHLAVTHDGITARIYIDGVQAASAAVSALTTPSSGMVVGALAFQSTSTPSAEFDGRLDELAFYPTALSAARIAAHHDDGLTNPTPDAPTGVVILDATDTTLTVGWTAPATGTAPTGYDVRVDGGLPTAVGLVTSHTVTGLTPATSYTIEVRSTTSGGASAWVPVVGTTDPPVFTGEYRVIVRLGDREWTVDAGSPPTYGPTLPLSFGWEVPEDSKGFPAQPDPDILNLGMVTASGAELEGVDIGTPARVSIYTSELAGARPFATFVGRVADMEATPHDLGLVWRILGVGYAADPGTARQVGTGAWPEESADARVARIMAEAGYPGWTSDPIGTTLEARGAQAANARDELGRTLEAAVTAEGNEWGPSRRVLYHPNADAAGDLSTTAPFSGTAVLRRTDALDFINAGLVNRRTTWRRTKLLDASWVEIDHPGGPTVYGDPRGVAYPPFSVPVLDPRELADMILDTTPGYRWLTGEWLRLEMWADEDFAEGLEWFYRDPASPPFPWNGRAVIVTGIENAPDGRTQYAGMLAGARVVLEPVRRGEARMLIEFRLRPEIPADSTVTMRWMDEPPAATWAEELAADPTGTWFAYRTTPRP